MSLTAYCRLFGFSKQAYYKSEQRRSVAEHNRIDALALVSDQRALMPRLGTRKLYHILGPQLKERGLKLGRDRLFDLLRSKDMLVKRKKSYTKTTDSHHWMRRYPNLIRAWVPEAAEQLWVADITYVRIRDGFRYLHLITDGYSKKVMGYELSKDLSAASTLKALHMALAERTYPMACLIFIIKSVNLF